MKGSLKAVIVSVFLFNMVLQVFSGEPFLRGCSGSKPARLSLGALVLGQA